MNRKDMFLFAAKAVALVCGVGVMLACNQSTAMRLSAEGYRQMGTPAANGMALLMDAAAADHPDRGSF